jgi:hypothetical protein
MMEAKWRALLDRHLSHLGRPVGAKELFLRIEE